MECGRIIKLYDKKKLLPSRIELLTLGYPMLKLGHSVYETYVRFNLGIFRG